MRVGRSRILFFLLSAAFGASPGWAAPDSVSLEAVHAAVLPIVQPNAARIAAIRGWLATGPIGPGAPMSDRTAWACAAQRIEGERLIATAETTAAEPIPALTDALYRIFSQRGTREEYQRPLGARRSRLQLLVWAEAVEGRRRFLPAIEATLAATLDEKTWVLPAHDSDLANFEGRRTEVDLGTAGTAWDLALADWWIGDELPPALRARLRHEIRRRAIDPYLAVISGGPRSSGWWWITGVNNWNAVCHAGVVGAALALPLPAEEKARIIAAAEANLPHYFSGIADDGYCFEGIAYWNYGFGHAVLLGRDVELATGGHVRLVAGAKARRIMAFPEHLAILPGVYPAFSDGDLHTQPDPLWSQPDAAPEESPLEPGKLRSLALYEAGWEVFAKGTAVPPAIVPQGPRFWFPDAQVLVSRASDRFGVAIKGGNNGQSHGHDSLGSFVIAVGQSTPVLDPGGEVYTARTFSAQRYDSRVLNSYGHDVPRVAGELQGTGAEFQAKVVTTEFTPESDRLVLDLTGAYRVPALQALHRELRVQRGAHPAITVTDRVTFSTPQSFGTSLVTVGPWRRGGANELIFGAGADQIRVRLQADGGALRLTPETLPENLPGGVHAMRMGIDLERPVTSGVIQAIVTAIP